MSRFIVGFFCGIAETEFVACEVYLKVKLPRARFYHMVFA